MQDLLPVFNTNKKILRTVLLIIESGWLYNLRQLTNKGNVYLSSWKKYWRVLLSILKSKALMKLM
jgi:hypothetical protein